MLTIRREQYEVFRPVAEQVFINEITDYLGRVHGERIIQLPDGALSVGAIPEERLRNMVKGGIAKARAYDMTSKAALTAFVVLMFLTAPNFDEHPLIQHMLLDEAIEPNKRLDELWQRTVDQNWVAVKQSYDPALWKLDAEEVER
ncbi:MAG: hypothetical protein ACJ8LM_16655 [Candidatus Udaeobacter sp.]